VRKRIGKNIRCPFVVLRRTNPYRKYGVCMPTIGKCVLQHLHRVYVLFMVLATYTLILLWVEEGSGQEGTNICQGDVCVCVSGGVPYCFCNSLREEAAICCAFLFIYIYNQIWTQTSGSEGGGAVPRLKDHKGNTVCVP